MAPKKWQASEAQHGANHLCVTTTTTIATTGNKEPCNDNNAEQYFPEDIVIEIIKRLPTKSICKFNLVSKSWYDMIKSPSFMFTHLHHNNNNHQAILVRNHRLEIEILKIDYSSGTTTSLLCCDDFLSLSTREIVGSINGLVCLASLIDENNPIVEEITLWNPFTRKSLILPSAICSNHPYSSVSVFGFGVDLIDGDYKVVRIVRPGFGDRKGFAMVYSFVRGGWKSISLPDFGDYCVSVSHKSVLMNGHLHWYCHRFSYKPQTKNDSILSFNLSDELFRDTLIMVPDDCNKKGISTDICNSSTECFTLISINDDGKPYSIWRMNEEYSWTKTHSFGVNLIIGEVDRIFGVSSDGEQILIGRIPTERKYELVWHDIKTKKTRMVIPHCRNGSHFCVHKYVESLMWV